MFIGVKLANFTQHCMAGVQEKCNESANTMGDIKCVLFFIDKASPLQVFQARQP